MRFFGKKKEQENTTEPQQTIVEPAITKNDGFETEIEESIKLVKDKLYEEADKKLLAIIQNVPNNAIANFWLGRVKMGMRNLQGAEDYFKKATALDPSNADGFFWLGRTYEYNNKFEQALKAFEKAVELNPEIANYHVTYGQMLKHFGELKYAWNQFAKAIELNPSPESTCPSDPYGELLGLLLNFKKFNRREWREIFEQAEQIYRSAVEAYPQESGFHSSLGWVLSVSANKKIEAESEFRKALAINSEDPLALSQLDFRSKHLKEWYQMRVF